MLWQGFQFRVAAAGPTDPVVVDVDVVVGAAPGVPPVIWAHPATDPARPVLLICNTQNRSSAVLRALRERGYGHVRYVVGGMSEWARRGWPMVAPRL